MMTVVRDVKQMTPLDPTTLPDGVYEGVWGGYVTKFTVGNVTYEGNTADGIRTPKARCLVTIRDGQITVEIK